MPTAYGCFRDAGEDTAAMRVVTVVGYGVSMGGTAAGGWDGEYTSREIKTEPLVIRRHARAGAEEQR